MKRILLPLSLLLAFSAFAQTPSDQVIPVRTGTGGRAGGYNIKVTFRPFKKQYIYLGHYFGKQYPIVDSALLNEKSEAVFKGAKTLPGGIYLIGYPDRSGFFEVLIDKQQNFSVIADTATIKKGIQFINSPDNEVFNNYQQYMAVKGKEIADAKDHLKKTTNSQDSVLWNEKLA